MSILEKCEEVDFSMESRTRQVSCLALAFVLASVVFLRMGTSHKVWVVALLLIAIEVGVSTLWSP